MTKPPGKFLPLVAALLSGAVLAQTASTSSHPTPSAATPVTKTAGHGLLSAQVTSERGAPSATKQPAQPPPKPAAPKPSADDWNLTGHGKVLYLTFDDGPQHEWTPKILQVLRKHNAHATFFVLGIQVAQYPELLAAERAAGHRIGNHTWDHKTLTQLPDAKVRQEIATGVKSNCLRPPTGATNTRIEAIVASYHLRQVLWDVDTSDWEKPGIAHIEREILSGARPGAIILMHDGGGNRSQTVAALDQALTKLTKQGYTYRSLPC